MSTARTTAHAMACAAFTLLAACSSHTSARPAATPSQRAAPTGSSTGASVTDPLTPANTTALQTALVSTVPAQVLPILAPAVRTRYAAKPFPLLPAGSRLSVDASALTQTGRTATVPATVTGTEPGRWLLLLVRDGRSWTVYGTRKLPA